MVIHLYRGRCPGDVDAIGGSMFEEGLREQAEFYSYHPLVNFFYFVFVIGVAMFSTHPVFLAMVLAAGCFYSALLKGKKAWKINMFLVFSMLLMMTVINAFFTHNGVTVLFYLNGNRVTVEALAFGGASALLLCGVVIWFGCFQVIMSSDKFIYLFGRIVPVLALTLSMIFRFIPLFQTRYVEIRNGQRCMGRGSGSWYQRIRQFFKELSILIAWSLEASIETSDSMEARGYGLKGRTSFHLYHFLQRDGIVLLVILVLGVTAVTGCAFGKTAIYYYPGIWIKPADLGFVVTLLSYLALLLLPIVIDIKGERKWKRLNLRM